MIIYYDGEFVDDETGELIDRDDYALVRRSSSYFYNLYNIGTIRGYYNHNNNMSNIRLFCDYTCLFLYGFKKDLHYVICEQLVASIVDTCIYNYLKQKKEGKKINKFKIWLDSIRLFFSRDIINKRIKMNQVLLEKYRKFRKEEERISISYRQI